MKIQKNKPTNKKKPIIIILIALVVVFTAGLVFSYSQNWLPFKKNATTDTSNIDKEDSTSLKSESNNKDLSPPTTPEDPTKKTPTQHDGDNPNNSDGLWGVVNYSQVVDGVLSIRVTIDQQLTSGVCSLHLTNGTRTITKEVAIAANPSSSTCKGFDIPSSELEKGVWNIRVNIDSDGKQGTITGTTSI